MPLSNLADPQPRLRARLLGSACSLLVDFGTPVSIGTVAAISTTLPENATARLRIGPAESFFEAVPLFDLRFDAGPITPPSGYSFSRASTATYIDAAGVLRIAAANTLRIDYDPATHECLGALLEESRTNLIRHSGDIANSVGAKFGAPVVTANAGMAPDGTMTTASLALSPASGFYQSVSAAGGETWIGSIWLRADAPGTFRQAVTGSPAGAVTRLIAVTTDWQRFSLGVTLAAGADHFGLQIDGTGGGGTIYAWGAQSEKAAEASTTIPTTSAAATRAADRQWLAGQVIDASAGLSAVVDFTKTSTAGTAVPLAFSTASTAFGNTWYVQVAPGGGMTLILNDTVHGDYPLPAHYAPYGPGNVQRVAFAAGPWDGVSFASSANPPITRPPVPTAAASFITLGLGGGAWGGAPGTVAGLLRIRRIAVYGTELTPGQVAALASTGSSLDAAGMAFDSSTIAAEVSDDSGGNLVLVLPGPASGRYLLLNLEASGAAAIDIGRIVAGPLWQPQRSYAYGIVEGRQINDRVDINPLTGARFPVPALVNPRFARFTLPLLTTAEVRGEFRALTRAPGAVGDLLWIRETTLNQTELNNRSLWGAAAAPGDLASASRDSFVAASRSFQIIERV